MPSIGSRMRLDHLMINLGQVLIEFPDATIRLGECSCCIYISLEGKEILKLDTDKDEFVFLQVAMVDGELQEAMRKLLRQQKMT
jgi:hypothetical protein